MFPSPKSHDHETIAPSSSVLVSVKSHANPEQLDVKEAVGGWFGVGTVRSRLNEPLAPSSSVAVSVTV